MGFPSSQDYVRLEKPRAVIGQGATNHQPSCLLAVTQWKPSLSDSSGCAPQSAAINALYAPNPQPSTATGCVTSSGIDNGPPEITDTQPCLKPAGFMTLTRQSVDDDDEEKDIMRLKMMFPNKDESYLSEIRRNNNTLNDPIDDILGDEGLKAVEGWWQCAAKLMKCYVVAENIQNQGGDLKNQIFNVKYGVQPKLDFLMDGGFK